MAALTNAELRRRLDLARSSAAARVEAVTRPLSELETTQVDIEYALGKASRARKSFGKRAGYGKSYWLEQVDKLRAREAVQLARMQHVARVKKATVTEMVGDDLGAHTAYVKRKTKTTDRRWVFEIDGASDMTDVSEGLRAAMRDPATRRRMLRAGKKERAHVRVLVEKSDGTTQWLSMSNAGRIDAAVGQATGSVAQWAQTSYVDGDAAVIQVEIAFYE